MNQEVDLDREYYENYKEYCKTVALTVTAMGGVLYSALPRPRIVNRSIGVHPINQLRLQYGAYYHLYQQLRDDDKRFFKSFRMTQAQFDELFRLIRPFFNVRDRLRHNPIPDEMRLVVTIAFLAHGDSIHTLASLFRIGNSTCREIIKEVTSAIAAALVPVYMKPPSVDDFKRIAQEFSDKWNLPHCLGAIDGKHVQLKKPHNAGSDFYNYKRNHSINLLAICDANYCFTVAEVGYLGCMSDGGIFRKSPYGQAITDKTLPVPPAAPLPYSKNKQMCEFYFVADEAFPLKENLIIPFGKASLNVEIAALRLMRRVCNYRISRARRVIENCFGILCTKWRVLYTTISAQPETANKYVKACVCLHNYIMKTKVGNQVSKPGYYGDIYGQNDVLLVEGLWRKDKEVPFKNTKMRANRNPPLSAREQRDMLAKYVCEDYVLDYQVNYVSAAVNQVNAAMEALKLPNAV